MLTLLSPCQLQLSLVTHYQHKQIIFIMCSIYAHVDRFTPYFVHNRLQKTTHQMVGVRQFFSFHAKYWRNLCMLGSRQKIPPCSSCEEFQVYDCTILSRSPSAAAVSSPLHTTPAPGVCSHVACHTEGERTRVWDGGGLHQHGHRNCARSSERRSESPAPPGTQSTGKQTRLINL